jgi:hypothetical protein
MKLSILKNIDFKIRRDSLQESRKINQLTSMNGNSTRLYSSMEENLCLNVRVLEREWEIKVCESK